MSVSGIASSTPYNSIFLRPRSANETPVEARRLEVASLPLKFDVKPASADHLQKMMEAKFTRPTGVPDNDPSELYAVIKVGDKIVGKVYNSGCETPNSLASVQFGGPDEDGLIGPALAQHRAEKIAKASGGKIEKSETAITQAEFDARPPRAFTVDYEALNAELERLRQSTYARASAYRALDLPLPGESSTDVKA